MAKYDASKIAEMLASARKKLAEQGEAVSKGIDTEAVIVAAGKKAVAAGDKELAEYIDSILVQHRNNVTIDFSATGLDFKGPEAVDQMYEFLGSSWAAKKEATRFKPTKILGVARRDIVYNKEQQEFIDRGIKGESLVLIGAAGYGKTTCQGGLSFELIMQEKILPLKSGTKWLKAGTPGVAVLSFTNKAVNNIRHALHDAIKPHALTIHKILEYAPIFYEVVDPESPSGMRKTMRFEPTRNKFNPLPTALKLIIIEEASMVSVELFEQLMDACPHNPQCIFLGDIQQLPPVFGSAILGFKMLELPVIELTTPYRQAMDSPIISLAWKILEGDSSVFNSKLEKTTNAAGKPRTKVPALEKLSVSNEVGTVVFQHWQKTLSADLGLITAVKQFNVWADQGYYNPEDDIILCPFNVSFGTIELNKGIAQHLGRKREAVVHEVIAGFEKYYLAVGDRVLYQKEDAFITNIAHNDEYLGKMPQLGNKFLDRWGHLRTEDMDADEIETTAVKSEEEVEFDLAAIDKFLAAAATDAEDRVAAASHVITLRIPATGEEVEIAAASDVNGMLGGYAITTHKSQGSEWEKVFFVMHASHATMNQRELLYTSVTRARKHLHIICEANTFERGVRSQKIKGNTLAEKAEEFKGKLEERERVKAERAANDPIKLAFALVPDFDEIAREAVVHWWNLAVKRWPHELTTKVVPNFNWRIKGSAAGLAELQKREIFLSPIYLHVDPNAQITDTIPHEVAHIVAKDVYGERGHGYGWKQVMLYFKRDPHKEHYHNMGSLPATLQKIMVDSVKGIEVNSDEEE
jgi:hypothetical protein